MSILAADTFDRADNADLGADWSPLQDAENGGDNFTIATNAAKPSSNGSGNDCGEIYTNATWPNDQWGEAVLGGVSASGAGAGSGIFLRGNAGASFSGYRVVANGTGWTITRWIAGAFDSTVASGTGTTWASGDTLYAEIQGTTLIVKKNTTGGAGGTTVTTQTVSATPASGSVGIGHSTTDTGAVITAWAGGDFSGGEPTAAQQAAIADQERNASSIIGRVDA